MLTVLFSIYKDENPDYLNRAFRSVFHDQILKPDQIVVVKDGPLTLELEDVITEWKKCLGDIFNVVNLTHNVGLGAALNEGLRFCKGDLIARMDTDDIAMPSRFDKQVAFMNQNSEITASSAIIEEWDESMQIKLGIRNLPLVSQDLDKFAKFRSPLSHPAVIFRKEAILEVGGYPTLRKAQDYALWSLLLVKGHKLANLPDTLLRMRTGNQMLNRRGWDYFKQEYQLLKFQKEIGFLSQLDFLMNTILKFILRTSPNFIKYFFYKIAR